MITLDNSSLDKINYSILYSNELGVMPGSFLYELIPKATISLLEKDSLFGL